MPREERRRRRASYNNPARTICVVCSAPLTRTDSLPRCNTHPPYPCLRVEYECANGCRYIEHLTLRHIRGHCFASHDRH